MKKLVMTSIFVLLLAGVSRLAAQSWPEEYLGLPGDNLNLYAVMNLFQQSETLEAFERGLNDPESMINNLDLNGDNLVDYIMVFDYKDGNIHNIVMRVALNRNEYQDVAVFTVEQFRDGSVQIQLVGDVALYGPNYIVEPIYAERPNPGYTGSVAATTTTTTTTTRRNVTVVHTTYYEVARWPVIVYIYQPVYRPWRSAWSWGYYPSYWYGWTPHYWHYYYGYHYNWYSHYYAYYRPWNHHRCRSYHTVYYTSRRNHSPTVVVNVNNGTYRSTYSRPEKRKEGEVLYAQRRANTGTTVPAKGTRGTRDNETIQTQRSSAPVSPRATRQTEQVKRSAPVSNTEQSARTSRQTPQRSTAGTTVERQAAPRKETTVRTERPATTTPRREAAAPKREQRVEPDRTSSRQSANSPRQSTTVRERQSSPERNVSPATSTRSSQPAVNRSQSNTQERKATPNARKSETKTPGRSAATERSSGESSRSRGR